MKYIYIILLLGFSSLCQAQITVIEEDKTGLIEGKAGIEDVYIFIMSNNKKEFVVFTDHEGKAILPKSLVYPIVVTLKHSNYKTSLILITNKDGFSKPIKLEYSNHNIDQIVVTGEPLPKPASKSLYNIRSISQKRIKAQGALKLNEVLSNELGIMLFRDPALGATTMQLQGIGGQNVKILIDGVPLIGRLGNSIDLEQINTSNIERIEIIEGPMAVAYGTNALAGLVNIITKKKQRENLSINLNLHEESAGNEYSIKKGIHNENFDIGYMITKNLFAKVDFGRNYHGGHQGEHTGRAIAWKPKNQLLGGALLRYKKNNYDIHYRLDYLNESIKTLGDLDSSTYKALDQEYIVNRFIHRLKGQTKIKEFANANLSISYADYTRRKRTFVKDLTTLEETLTKAKTDQDTSSFSNFNFRGSLSNFVFLENSRANLEVGTEVDLNNGSGGRIKGDNPSIQDIAMYGSLTYHFTKNLSAKSGIRWASNSMYQSPLIPSLRLRYGFAENWNVKASYGKGFRAPTLKELYFEFVDANHNIFGNKDLNPEFSDHYDLSITRQKENGKTQHKTELQAYYNDLDQLIGLASDASTPGQFRYINIDKYKTISFTLREEISHGHLFAKVGASYIGRYQSLSQEFDVDEFLFSPEINGQVTYNFEEIRSDISLFYKFIGSREAYQYNGKEILRSKIESYSWVDASIAHRPVESLEVRLGAKNLLNVKDVNSTLQGNTAHGTGGGSLPISYGRSLYLKLSYSFVSPSRKNK